MVGHALFWSLRPALSASYISHILLSGTARQSVLLDQFLYLAREKKYMLVVLLQAFNLSTHEAVARSSLSSSTWSPESSRTTRAAQRNHVRKKQANKLNNK